MKKLIGIALAIALLLVMAPMDVLAYDSGDVWITASNESNPLNGKTINGNIIVQVGNSVRNKVIIKNCTINGNIEIISGNVTDIGPGNTINGNVEIGSGAYDTWVYTNSSQGINGNIEAKGASYVIVMGNTVSGNIELEDCTNPKHKGPNGEDIWDNNVDGNIEIKNSPDYVVDNNTVSGDVEIE